MLFFSLILKVKIWYDIFFASLLLAIAIVSRSHSRNISKHVFIKALISKSRISLPVSLGSMESYTSRDRSKSIIGRSGSSPSIYSCKEWPTRSERIASISSSLSAPRKCLGLTLSSQILYRHSPTSSALKPYLYGAEASRKSESLDWIIILY